VPTTLTAVPIKPSLARDIARWAKQVETARQKRDELIVQAHAEGGGMREIGRVAGLTHRAVIKIIERKRS
jgi:hypothetical protein